MDTTMKHAHTPTRLNPQPGPKCSHSRWAQCVQGTSRTIMLTAVIAVSAGAMFDETNSVEAESLSSLTLAKSTPDLVLRGKVALRVDFGEGPDKVVFQLDGPAIITDSEREAPWYFGGDKNGTPRGWDSTQVPDGRYTLTAQAYKGRNVVATQVHGFEVRNATSAGSGSVVTPYAPEPANATDPAPDQGLIGDAPAVRAVSGVANGQTVQGNLNISADIWNGVPSRVVFEMVGPDSVKHTERVAPYFFAGDRAGVPNGFDSTMLADGNYTLTVRAFDDGGNPSDPAVVRFTVDNVAEKSAVPPTADPAPPLVNPEAAPEHVTPSLPLVELTGWTGLDVRTALSGKQYIGVGVAGPEPEKVVFQLQGPRNHEHTERFAPYTFGGERNGWNTANYPNGTYRLTAIAYVDGQVSGSRTTSFAVENTAAPAPNPVVTPKPPPDPTPTNPSPAPQPTPEPIVQDPPSSGSTPVPAGAPVLVPGPSANSTAPVVNLNPTGNVNQYAADKNAITRWSVVPWQSFTGPLAIGVVAFHANDIDRVEFSVNGGQWTSVRQMSLNHRTGVKEYVTVLDPTTLPSGKVVVKAVAYPKNGVPVIVPVNDINQTELVLYNNVRGSLSHATITVGQNGLDDMSQAAKWLENNNKLNGATIYLPEGNHRFFGGSQLDKANTRWFTVTSAPGADPKKVKITNYDNRMARGRIRLHNLTLATGKGIDGGGSDAYIWFDNIEYYDPNYLQNDKASNDDIKGFDGGEWWTDSYVHHMRLGGASDFIRSTRFENIGEDAIKGYYFIANVDMVDIRRPDGTKYHPDMAQSPETRQVIIYDMTVSGQSRMEGWNFGGEHFRDVAIVDSVIDMGELGGKAYQFGSKYGAHYENFLTINGRFDGLTAFRRGDNYGTWTLDTFTIRNSVFNSTPGKLPDNWDTVGVVVQGTVSAD